MHGRSYTGLIIAENQSPQTVQVLRKNYQQLYSKLSPLQKVQISDNQSLSSSKSRSFLEMDGKQKAAMIGGAATSLAGVAFGAVVGAASHVGVVGGAMLGGQVTVN